MSQPIRRILPAALINLIWGSITAVFAQGPAVVTNINPNTDAAIQWVVRAGDRIYFQANDGKVGAELWSFDGAGARLVKDIQSGPIGSSPRELAAVGNKLFFNAGTPTAGAELWISDGTALGTKLVKDILPGRLPSNPIHLFSHGGKVYFSANDGRTGHELWTSDGTANGTKLVKDIWPGGGIGQDSMPRHFAAIPFTTRFVFQAHDGKNGRELWVSDGTGAGTKMVKDIRPGVLGSTPSFLHAYQGKVYFHADDGTNGHELWVTDGTANGTKLVRDIATGRNGSRPSHFANLNGLMFFRATTSFSGTELWVSDGTAQNTRKLKEIDPSNTGSNPSFLTTTGSRHFYFSADDGNTGRELWVSDGTAAGTRLIADTAPGKNGIAPRNNTEMRHPQFAVLQGRVYFGAATASGTELWSFDNGATATVVTGSGCIEPWPTVTATDPTLGAKFAMSGQFTKKTAGSLYLGLPIPRGIPLAGCRLYLYPSTLVKLGDFNTTAFRIAGHIPNIPALDGFTVRIQAARLEYALPLVNIELTNAVDLTIGR